jgi:hypothetical protein
MEPQQTNSNKKIGIGIGIVALLAIAAVVFGAKKSEPVADTTSSTTPVASSTTSPASATATASNGILYKDGTYMATGSYMSPGGLDHVGVSLTLKNDIVTDATVTPEPGDKTSAYYQGMFVANYKPLVVGKDISTLQISKVSGSSLTSIGFNDALKQIEVQAKA